MDDIMKDKFSSTFNKIKEAFNETFRKLFNGGKAELKLTDHLIFLKQVLI